MTNDLFYNNLKLGNDNYKRANYRDASKKYRKAIYLLEKTSIQNEEEEIRWKSTMLKLYLNMSQICLKQLKPKKTIFYCKSALYLDEQNVKALYRYGSSLRLLQDFERARKFLLRAHGLAPNDKDISNEIEKLNEYDILFSLLLFNLINIKNP
jgi:tetratricopeptide (TPR) repeat protein